MHLSYASGSSSPCEIRFRNSEGEKLTGSMYLVLLLISSSTLLIPLVLFNVWLQNRLKFCAPDTQGANREKRTAFSAFDSSFHLVPMIFATCPAQRSCASDDCPSHEQECGETGHGPSSALGFCFLTFPLHSMVKNIYGERAFVGVPLSFLLFALFSYNPFPRMSRQSKSCMKHTEVEVSFIFAR